jgi:sialate O-acetylesterase
VRIAVASCFIVLLVLAATAGAQSKPTGTAIPAPLALSEGPVPCFVFCDNAVLQRDMKVPVWGTAKPGHAVSVSFAGQQVTGTAAQDGRWRVVLEAMKANAQPSPMTISAGGQTVTLSNIRVGDVWLCAGQSNMDLPFNNEKFSDPKLVPTEDLSDVWLFQPSTNKTSSLVLDMHRSDQWPAPQHRAPNAWRQATAANAKAFSMIGYYFGRDVAKAQKVPVGMINVAVGGSTVGQWCSPEADAQARGGGGKVRSVAVKPYADDSENADWLYGGTIHPIVGLAMKGVLWYQGESEAAWFFNAKYDAFFTALIKDYRAKWGIGDFPWLFVQIQGQTGKNDPAIREMQSRGLSEPNTAMAVCADVNAGLHPSDKRVVAQRLVLAARALAYGEKIEYMGPIYKSHKTAGDKLVVTFEHVGTGLVAKEGAPLGQSAAQPPVDGKGRAVPVPFMIAGADGKFLPADAAIEPGAGGKPADSVVLSNPDVKQPVAVRYGWDVKPTLTLYNKEGLPASPFRVEPKQP